MLYYGTLISGNSSVKQQSWHAIGVSMQWHQRRLGKTVAIDLSHCYVFWCLFFWY